MTKNQFLKVLFGLFGLCLLLSSCTKDFIDQQPETITPKTKAMPVMNDLLADVKVPIKSASTSSYQSSTYTIEKAFDGSMTTIYHSKYWSGELPQNYWPIDMVFNFEPTAIHYFTYYPRVTGTGRMMEFDLYYALGGSSTYNLIGTYNFQGVATPSTLPLPEGLENVTSIKFVVKSGTYDYITCAEMEFFQKNSANYDYRAIFADEVCSQLKPGVTQEIINSLTSPFFKQLATEILNNEYNHEFRVQSYKAWQHPSIMEKVNKTLPLSIRDNPTGIWVNEGDEFVVITDNKVAGQSIYLYIQDLNNGYANGSSYTLLPGVNKFVATTPGLIYVTYLINAEVVTQPDIRLNITGGYVNGYFDSQKHSRADWTRLLNASTYRHFDVLGKLAHLTFDTDKFKANTPDGLSLINKYDEIVYKEQDFMGLYKYNKHFKNRIYLHVQYEGAYMAATNFRTYYSAPTINDLTTLTTLTINPWGVAHEIGHAHQTRPLFKWLGITEVSNNLHTLYIQTEFGNISRMTAENRFVLAHKDLVLGEKPHNLTTIWQHKLVPFWQLKLYMNDVLKTDFYKDLYEYFRNQNDVPTYGGSTEGIYQLNFVVAACEVSKMDLTDFFMKWGFLRPIDATITDYRTEQFTITQDQIDQVLALIASKNYPKPPHNNIELINDNNMYNYQSTAIKLGVNSVNYNWRMGSLTDGGIIANLIDGVFTNTVTSNYWQSSYGTIGSTDNVLTTGSDLIFTFDEYSNFDELRYYVRSKSSSHLNQVPVQFDILVDKNGDGDFTFVKSYNMPAPWSDAVYPSYRSIKLDAPVTGKAVKMRVKNCATTNQMHFCATEIEPYGVTMTY